MNELYKELLKYLDDNFIEYKELGDFILEIFVGQVIKQTVITTFFHLEVYGGI